MRQFVLGFGLFLTVFSAKADFDRFEYFTAPKLLILTNSAGDKSYEFTLPAQPLYIDYTWIHVGPNKFVTFVGFTFLKPGSQDKENKFEHKLYRLVEGSKTIPSIMIPVERKVGDFDPFKLLLEMSLPMEHKLTKSVGDCADEDKLTISYLKSLMGIIPVRQSNEDHKIIKGQLHPNVPEYQRLFELYETFYSTSKQEEEEEEHIQPTQGQEAMMGSLSGSIVGSLVSLFTTRPPAQRPPPPIQDEATIELADSYSQLEAQIAAVAERQAANAWGPKTAMALDEIFKKPS